jgi:hypothetical protein
MMERCDRLLSMKRIYSKFLNHLGFPIWLSEIINAGRNKMLRITEFLNEFYKSSNKP